MNYVDHLFKLRNDIHRDIVQEATVRTMVRGYDTEGVLLLKEPISFGGTTVSSICCETGLLLSEDGDKIIPYQKLTVEDLAVLHNRVVQSKQYSFTPNTQLV
jgi:hypothetical protein